MTETNDKPIELKWHSLTYEESCQFDEEGYLIVRGILDAPTICKLIEAGDRLMASDRRENRQVSHSELYDSFRNCVAIDGIFIPLLTNEKILSIVVQLLGAHLQLMTSHLIYKHPDPPGTSKNARSPGWHRDYGSATKVLGNGVPRILLKCGYYFTNLSEPNSGATLVAPGSNHLVERLEIPEGQSDPVNFVEPSLKPGDCLLFENRTWHAGAANLTTRIRKGIMIGYGYRWVMPMTTALNRRMYWTSLVLLVGTLLANRIRKHRSTVRAGAKARLRIGVNNMAPLQ